MYEEVEWALFKFGLTCAVTPREEPSVFPVRIDYIKAVVKYVQSVGKIDIYIYIFDNLSTLFPSLEAL
jgi:hypothetical protein